MEPLDPAEIAKQIETLISERDRYRVALEEIANQDYRGPRSPEMGIAWRALNPEVGQ